MREPYFFDWWIMKMMIFIEIFIHSLVLTNFSDECYGFLSRWCSFFDRMYWKSMEFQNKWTFRVEKLPNQIEINVGFFFVLKQTPIELIFSQWSNAILQRSRILGGIPIPIQWRSFLLKKNNNWHFRPNKYSRSISSIEIIFFLIQ